MSAGRTRLPGWLLAALLALSALAPAQAYERILRYDTEVVVAADGSLEVTEHIRVRAEGDRIRRGIYRDFPTRYRDRHGNHVRVGFEVLAVERDGRPEPWFTERRNNGVRLNTGDDRLLPAPLETTYTLRYRTTHQLGFFEAHDELYWNAIGHGWAFPVERGTTVVRLPAPVPADAMEVDGWTGAQGARGKAFQAEVAAPGVVRWRLAAPLAPREGFTVLVAFPKGLVPAPTRAQTLLRLLVDNLSVLAALLGLGGISAYCLARWRAVGRDPRPGVVIVRYAPPRGESPSALRYMVRRGYDTTCMSADLLDCAVQGAIDIEREDRLLGDRWTLQRRSGATVSHPDGQRLLEALLPAHQPRMVLEKDQATHVQAAMDAHRGGLAARFQPEMFQRNVGSAVMACMLLGLAVVVSVALSAVTGGGGMPLLFVPLALALVVVIVFSVVVGAPTPEGRRLLDEIEGFKRYLSVAEQEELAKLQGPWDFGPPKLDAARFEALLPYAVALGVEKAWTDKFTAAVGSAAAAAAVSGMAWYHGRRPGDIGGFTSSIGSALGAQIASASTPPGSSSGSGGGGFSGGGGGGGGGGGR